MRSVTAAPWLIYSTLRSGFCWHRYWTTKLDAL